MVQGNYKVIVDEVGRRGATRRINYTGKTHSYAKALALVKDTKRFDKKWGRGVRSNAKIVKVKSRRNVSPFGIRMSTYKFNLGNFR